LLEREITALGQLLGQPASPFVAVVGGAKVADKLGVLQALIDHVDALIVGGGMAFTFLAAHGHAVGASLLDAERIDDCKELLGKGKPILLPTDIVALEAGAAFGRGETAGEVRMVGADVPEGFMGLDIGPDTIAAYGECLSSAGTVLWNGPMGVFEDARFSAGTAGVARSVAACSGYTVVGGGDSVAAIGELSLEDQIDFISTGGGASLELLEFGDLPGLAALRGAPNAPGGDAR
jgi:phosphoglycerate kinase